MSRSSEAYQEQQEQENLSGALPDAYFACHPLRQWVDEMHAIAVGIEAEGVAFKKRMTLLQQPLASRPDATKTGKGN